MLDGSLLFKERNTKWTYPKYPKIFKAEVDPTYFLISVDHIISGLSCKILKECFMFPKTWRNILRTGPKVLQSTSNQSDKCCEILFSTLIFRVIQKTLKQNFIT